MTTDGYSEVAKPAFVLPDPLSMTTDTPVSFGAYKRKSQSTLERMPNNLNKMKERLHGEYISISSYVYVAAGAITSAGHYLSI